MLDVRNATKDYCKTIRLHICKFGGKSRILNHRPLYLPLMKLFGLMDSPPLDSLVPQANESSRAPHDSLKWTRTPKSGPDLRLCGFMSRNSALFLDVEILCNDVYRK